MELLGLADDDVLLLDWNRNPDSDRLALALVNPVEDSTELEPSTVDDGDAALDVDDGAAPLDGDAEEDATPEVDEGATPDDVVALTTLLVDSAVAEDDCAEDTTIWD